MSITKLTNTSLFLLPSLEVGAKNLADNGFIDAFLDDIEHDNHYENAIYILFKPHDFDLFSYFLTKERKRITVIEDYDYEEYVVVVYELPKEFLDDYQLFLEGKYSKFSDKFKSKFDKTVERGNIIQDTFQWRVFTKDKTLRDYWERKFDVSMEEENEVWGIPDLSKEVLDIEEIKASENNVK